MTFSLIVLAFNLLLNVSAFLLFRAARRRNQWVLDHIQEARDEQKKAAEAWGRVVDVARGLGVQTILSGSTMTGKPAERGRA